VTTPLDDAQAPVVANLLSLPQNKHVPALPALLLVDAVDGRRLVDGIPNSQGVVPDKLELPRGPHALRGACDGGGCDVRMLRFVCPVWSHLGLGEEGLEEEDVPSRFDRVAASREFRIEKGCEPYLRIMTNPSASGSVRPGGGSVT
jgi:hypothetical protein